MPRRIAAGELRHLISIQSHGGEGTYDTYGQISASTTNWTTDQNLRAKVEPLQGQEAVLAQQTYPKATHRVTTEYYSALNSTGATRKRILFGSRVLHIGAILNEEEESWHLELLCGEER